MMKCQLALIAILLIFNLTFQTAVPQDAEPKTIRVLIVDDHSPGYYNMPTAITIRNILRADKRFEVVLIEDAEILGTDIPFDYDVIFLQFKNRRIPKRNEAMQKNLEKFVTEGGGLFIYHFACGAFEDWSGFEQLAGRVWEPAKPPHDPYGLFSVQIADKTHPITRNLDNFEIRDELYTCLKDSDVPIRILAEAVSKVDGKTYPMAFVLDNDKGKGDKGRVFHTTLGHNDQSLSSVPFQTMMKNALVWCAKRDAVQ